jgi:hypothetical protein
MLVKKLVLGLGLCLGLSSAYATVINLNSYYNGGPFDRETQLRNPVLYPVKAGVYRVEFLRAGDRGASYVTANFWNNVSNCDSAGANCQNGWSLFFRYDTVAAQSNAETLAIGDLKSFASAEAAFMAGAYKAPDKKRYRYIYVEEDTTLRFFMADNWHYDNVGGVSFEILLLVPGTGLVAPGKR